DGGGLAAVGVVERHSVANAGHFLLQLVALLPLHILEEQGVANAQRLAIDQVDTLVAAVLDPEVVTKSEQALAYFQSVGKLRTISGRRGGRWRGFRTPTPAHSHQRHVIPPDSWSPGVAYAGHGTPASVMRRHPDGVSRD